MRACDYVVARLPAYTALSHVDEGVAWEMGYAAALQKSVVLVVGDDRIHTGTLNPMLWQCAKAVFTEKELWRWVSAH